jgi:hypothetical protein
MQVIMSRVSLGAGVEIVHDLLPRRITFDDQKGATRPSIWSASWAGDSKVLCTADVMGASNTRFNMAEIQQSQMELLVAHVDVSTHGVARCLPNLMPITRWVVGGARPRGDCCDHTHRIPTQCCSALSFAFSWGDIEELWHCAHYKPMCTCPRFCDKTKRSFFRDDRRSIFDVPHEPDSWYVVPTTQPEDDSAAVAVGLDLTIALLRSRITTVLEYITFKERVFLMDLFSTNECDSGLHSIRFGPTEKRFSVAADLARWCARHEKLTGYINAAETDLKKSVENAFGDLLMADPNMLWRTKITSFGHQHSKQAKLGLAHGHEIMHMKYKDDWEVLMLFFDRPSDFARKYIREQSGGGIETYDHSFAADGPLNCIIVNAITRCIEEDVVLFQKRELNPLPVVHVVTCDPVSYRCDATYSVWDHIERWANRNRYEMNWWLEDGERIFPPSSLGDQFQCGQPNSPIFVSDDEIEEFSDDEFECDED